MNKTFLRMKNGDVHLCAFRSDDEAIEKYLTWLNDEEIAFYLGRHNKNLTWSAESRWVNTDHELDFNICVPDQLHPGKLTLIGTCDIKTTKDTRNALLGIVIGDPEYQNKGYGTIAIRMLVKYCFEELGKHNVSLQVDSSNERAIACYKKAGFVECGRERETNFHRGKWTDCITMQILEQDYFNQE